MAERPCSIDGCVGRAGIPGTGRGMCNAHYKKLRKYGDPLHVVRKRNVCSVDDCERFVFSQSWCSMHYSRWKRYGSPTFRLPGDVVDGKRICPGCSVDRPLADWGQGQGYCRRCAADRTRQWRSRNPQYVAAPRDPVRQAAYSRSWRMKNPDRVRAATALRRARRALAVLDEVSPAAVFERDEWICRICHVEIDQKLAYPHPMSASVDHIVPLSRGGAHSMANCQATHLRCNLRKYNKTEV